LLNVFHFIINTVNLFNVGVRNAVCVLDEIFTDNVLLDFLFPIAGIIWTDIGLAFFIDGAV
jgi:hypothetical protein